MSLLGIIALVFGILGVILTVFQSIWCWPAALISIVVSTFVFFNQKLFGDMALQVFYFICAIYGWWFWNSNKNKSFVVVKVPKKTWLWLIVATVIQAGVYFLILKNLKGDQIILDSSLTACSITATYMMTKKWVENWLCWVIIDLFYVALYAIKDMLDFSILYFAFSIMAVYGFYLWRKKAL